MDSRQCAYYPYGEYCLDKLLITGYALKNFLPKWSNSVLKQYSG